MQSDRTIMKTDSKTVLQWLQTIEKPLTFDANHVNKTSLLNRDIRNESCIAIEDLIDAGKRETEASLLFNQWF